MARPTKFQQALKALVRKEVEEAVIRPLLQFGEKRRVTRVEPEKPKRRG